MKKLLFILVTILTAPTADAMSFARRALDRITKVAYYAPITLYSANMAKNIITSSVLIEHEVSQLRDADEDTTRFVHKNLAAIGLKNPESVHVKIDDGRTIFAAALSTTNTLVLDSDVFEPSRPRSLLQMIYSAHKRSILPLPAIALDKSCKAAAIQHEGAHLKYHDSESTFAIYAVSPLATSYIVQKTKKVLQKNTHNNPTMLRMLSRIPGGIGLCALSMVGTLLGLQYLERRADNAIIDDKDLLRASALLYKEIADREDFLSNGYGRLTSLCRSPHHPSPHARYKRFQARLDALEKQEQQSSAK